MGVRADGTVTEVTRKTLGETAAVGTAAAVDGLGTVGGFIRGAKTVGGLGSNFKMSRPKTTPLPEGGETVKGEVSP